MADFIFNDKGKSIAWIVGGKVFSGSKAQMIATISEGKIYSLDGDLVGHLQVAGLVIKDGVGIPDAFSRLLHED